MRIEAAKSRVTRLEHHRRTDERITTRFEPDEHGHQWLSVVRQYHNGDSLTIRLPSKLPIEQWTAIYGK